MRKKQRSAKTEKPVRETSRNKLLVVAAVVACVLVGVIVMITDEGTDTQEDRVVRLTQNGLIIGWWDPVPIEVRDANLPVRTIARDVAATHPPSNIMRQDYSGPEACSKCHRQQFDAWSEHPHRWMNALAEVSTVKGDFTGTKSVSYLGGRATFVHRDGHFRMRLERDAIVREYLVTQTIGSRFYQYYVGRLLEGPEPRSHIAYTEDHVLPFGYWLDRKEWVPTVHVHFAELAGENVDEEDLPASQRHDPFAPPHEKFSFTAYYQCSHCHTTMPLGDLLVRNPEVVGKHAPVSLHLDTVGYLQQTHPEVPNPAAVRTMSNEQAGKRLYEIEQQAKQWDARDHAVTLGISCEACHLGAKEHAQGKQKHPHFFPESPYLFAYSDSHQVWESGRSHDNVNWACGRCHAGGRRLLAGGMATWNSTEYTDAMRGSCYSELRCIDCHNPHEATGSKWTQTETENDAVCLRCHQELKDDKKLQSHTHHAPDSAGSRCLDCHMPRVNEGLQDIVRTHMIYSPTQPAMIEANHPNACNMCHTEKPIDWALRHLKDWY